MTEQRKVWITAESFKIKEATDKGVIIKGLALPFGKQSRNGGTYDTKKTTEIVDTLKNKPVLYNHDESKSIGHTTENISVDEEGVHYEVDIDPKEEDIVRKIKRGDISNVSIQGLVDSVDENNNIFLKEFLEMSFVTIPGFGDTNITSIEKLLNKKEKTVKEPFAGFKNWEDCIKQVKKDQGYDDETAKKVCGELKKKYEETIENQEDSEVSNKYPANKTINMSETEKKEEKEKVKEQEDKGYEDNEGAEEDTKEILEKIVTRIEKLEERITVIEKANSNNKGEEKKKGEAEESVTEGAPRIEGKKELSPDSLREMIKGDGK